MRHPNVLVALSGGVDSAVCAHLLQKQGYAVTGVVLKMSPAHEIAVDQARACAEVLGIPLLVQDQSERFEETVIRPFIDHYRAGQTPNPCIICNPNVKFRALAEVADAHGIPLLATGHYAALVRRGEDVLLARGKSHARDQSYMLYRLGQNILRRLLLPLSAYEKPAIREIAAALNLPCASQPDSQEICFIPDNDYAGFIERRIGESPFGDFIDPYGQPCGRHRGVLHYTVGQRKGLGVALGYPAFVTGIDADQNTVRLGTADQLLTDRLGLVNVISSTGVAFSAPFTGFVKIRSTAALTEARIEPTGEGECIIQFPSPLRAPAAGQSTVIYDKEEVLLGGGIVRDNGI